MSAHPFPFEDGEIDAIDAALEALETAAATDKLLVAEVALLKEATQRWRQNPTVDGWEMMALAAAGRAATRAGIAFPDLKGRWLEARDRHLEQQPHAVRSLRYLMSEITESLLQASWTDQTPYLCWALAEGTSSAQERVEPEIIDRLRDLRERALGWWVWPSFDVPDFLAPAPLLVPVEEWREHLGKDRAGRIEDLLRWTREAFGQAQVPTAEDVLY